jgi:transcriptional regulator with XRE-family HTH domain
MGNAEEYERKARNARILEGVALRTRRQSAGLTLRVFARALGLSYGSLLNMERGKKPITAELLSIVDEVLG